jgi:protocatechuate 3,4-dioxygenase beta subunit
MLKFLPILLLITTTGCSNIKSLSCSKREQKIEKSQANSQPVEVISNHQPFLDNFSCPITPSHLEKTAIPPIYKSNNLRKRIGYITEAKGQKIIISGIITDSNCSPITNARIDLWQADSLGFYKSFQPNPYLNDQRLYKKSEALFTENYETSTIADENFTGSGSITTDNLGRFHFLTIKPGSQDKKDPVIHIRILHKNFPEFHSLLFFPENYKANPLQKPNKILEGKENNYYYKITLMGENPFNKP